MGICIGHSAPTCHQVVILIQNLHGVLHVSSQRHSLHGSLQGHAAEGGEEGWGLEGIQGTSAHLTAMQASSQAWCKAQPDMQQAHAVGRRTNSRMHAPPEASQPAAGAAPGPLPPREVHTAAAPPPRRAAGRPHPTAAMGGRVGAGGGRLGGGAAVRQAGRVMPWVSCAEKPAHRRPARGVKASRWMASTVQCISAHVLQPKVGSPLACAAPPPAAPPLPASCGWRHRPSAAGLEASQLPAAPAAQLPGPSPPLLLMLAATAALAAAALPLPRS